MAALTPAELPELMGAIANASIKRTTRCLLEWQLHTMTRQRKHLVPVGMKLIGKKRFGPFLLKE